MDRRISEHTPRKATLEQNFWHVVIDAKKASSSNVHWSSDDTIVRPLW